MKLKTILYCCFTFFAFFSFAQNISFEKALTVYPVSPEAASLGKYGDLPVNLATGRINYAVPLYTIKVGDFEWPISLSYNYSGLRTEEDPSMTGLGWDLMANGRISQEVRGFPDHLDNTTFKKDYVFPYLNGEFNSLSVEEKNKKVLTIYQRIASSYGFDGQQDLYHFNAGSLQGSFLYDQKGKAVFPSHKNYQVNDKTITDDKGVKYHFEQIEKGEIEVSLGGDSFPRETKGWLLSKIELPNNQGNILFYYDDQSTKNTYSKTVWTETRTTGFKRRFIIGTNESKIYTRPLKKITFPGGKIEFDVSQFESVNSVRPPNHSQPSNGNTLNKISIYEGDSFISGYTFSYSNAAKFKKVLKTITKLDNQKKSHPYYNFEYYDEDELRDNIPYTQQDLWGYYNAKSNTNLIGRNSSSNFTKTRIGALKKITYPTQGHSIISYEPNSISVVENKEDEKENLAEIYSYSHNETFKKRINLQPNDSQTIDTLIDLGSTQIVNAFASISVTPENPSKSVFAEVVLSLSQEESFSLPRNSKYQPLNLHLTISEEDLFDIKTPRQTDGSVAKSNQKLAFVKNGKIRIQGDLTTAMGANVSVNIRINYDGSTADKKYNKNIGGIRVASVTDALDKNNQTTTHYRYITANGKDSSGKLLTKKLFFTHITSHVEREASSYLSGYNYHQFARSKQPFTSYQGNPVLYERVELIKNNGALGKTINMYSTAENISKGFPYPPVINTDWKKGKLLSQTVLNAQGNTIEVVQNQYKEVYPYGKTGTSSKVIQGLVVGRYHFDAAQGINHYEEAIYKEYPKMMVLSESTKTSFQGNVALSKTTTYTYDNPYVQLKQKQENLSNSDTHYTKYVYPYDKTNHPLTAKNRLSEVVSQETYLKKGGVENLKKIISQEKIYKEENGLVVPHKLQTAKGDHPLEDRVVFDRYDRFGNVLQSHAAGEDGLYTVSLWGYNGQYLIAKIANATYAEVHSALGLLSSEEPDENDLVLVDDLRASKPEWQITTYQHQPLVGISKITPPNGVSIHYGYDAFNRLKSVKDKDGNLLETYRYHLAGRSTAPPASTGQTTGNENQEEEEEETPSDFKPNPKNPYSVSNMRKAFTALQAKNTTNKKTYTGKIYTKVSQIESTHNYVRFWIENEQQHNHLLEKELELSTIPLDYLYTEQQIEALEQDNETSSDLGRWLYTAVEENYTFLPNIKYEILENLFLPEPAYILPNQLSLKNAGIDQAFLFDLEDTSLELAGYAENKSTSAKRSKLTPEGYLKIKNTLPTRSILFDPSDNPSLDANGVLNYGTAGVNYNDIEPLIGVKVKTRRWFKWAKGWTDENGYYKVNRGYRRDPKYTIVFKNEQGFKIWPSAVSISSARYRAGKHSNQGYTRTFENNSVAWQWGTVNNATVKYFKYCEQLGITKPHDNLRIVAFSNVWGLVAQGAAPMLRRTLGSFTISKAVQLLSVLKFGVYKTAVARFFLQKILPDVVINANRAARGTDKIYETVFHELGHASHYRQVGNGYWGKYMDHVIANGGYGNGTETHAGYTGVGEMWGNYIAAVMNSMTFGKTVEDELNNELNWYNPGFLYEVVNEIEDLTLIEAFSCLHANTTSIAALVNELKTKTQYDEKIDEIYFQYDDWPTN